MRKPMFVTGIAVASLISGVFAAVPAAAMPNPDTVHEVAHGCVGPSPNLVDIPFNGMFRVRTSVNRPGLFDIGGGGTKAVFPYRTDATIEWWNLDNGRRGTRYVSYPTHFSSIGYWLYGTDSGRGRVRITVTGTQRGLLTFPAPVCSGEVVI